MGSSADEGFPPMQIRAGILAIPLVTQEAGFVVSSVTCIVCWVFMVVIGLLVVEVNVRTMCELGSGGVSLISITFRKMDESKLSYNYLHDPELMNIKPLLCIPMMKLQVQQNQNEDEEIIHGGLKLLQRPSVARFLWRNSFPLLLPSTT